MHGGPKPRPTGLKLLDGTKPCRINNDEPAPAEGGVRPARQLDAMAQRYWDSVAEDLIAKKVVTGWDCETLTRWCEWSSLFERLLAQLDETGGVVIEGRQNGIVKNPLWQALRDSSQQIDRLADRLGLNPSERSRLHVDLDNSDPTGAERLLS